MPMALIRAFEWLELTAIGTIVRESAWGFQIVVAIHILGLMLSVGTLVWFDLRLLGVGMTRSRVSDLYRRLVPWTATGFLIMFVSGSLLFVGYATKASANTYFRVKMIAIIFAAVNALVYHRITERQIAQWNDSVRPPMSARIAGLSSIVLWMVVILMGRMMSYTMF